MRQPWTPAPTWVGWPANIDIGVDRDAFGDARSTGLPFSVTRACPHGTRPAAGLAPARWRQCQLAGLPLTPAQHGRLALAHIGGVLDLQHGMGNAGHNPCSRRRWPPSIPVPEWNREQETPTNQKTRAAGCFHEPHHKPGGNRFKIAAKAWHAGPAQTAQRRGLGEQRLNAGQKLSRATLRQSVPIKSRTARHQTSRKNKSTTHSATRRNFIGKSSKSR